MSAPIELSLVLGSAREGRLCERVADWSAARISAHGGYAISRVDPRDLDRPPIEREEALADIGRTLDRADAFLIVTPEYNHSYPAPLKQLIDAFGAEWRAKPVAFVAYGGVSGGLRAVEHLRQVLAELHATTIRDSVSFANAWNLFGPGADSPPGADAAMGVLLSSLAWWARALGEARMARPYAQAIG